MAIEAAMRKLQELSKGGPEPVNNQPPPTPESSPNAPAQSVPSWDQIMQMREQERQNRGLQPGDEVPDDEETMMGDPDGFMQFAQEFSAGGMGDQAQSDLAAERSQMPDFLPPGMKQLMAKYSVMNMPPAMPPPGAAPPGQGPPNAGGM